MWLHEARHHREQLGQGAAGLQPLVELAQEADLAGEALLLGQVAGLGLGARLGGADLPAPARSSISDTPGEQASAKAGDAAEHRPHPRHRGLAARR